MAAVAVVVAAAVAGVVVVVAAVAVAAVVVVAEVEVEIYPARSARPRTESRRLSKWILDFADLSAEHRYQCFHPFEQSPLADHSHWRYYRDKSSPIKPRDQTCCHWLPREV